MSCQPARKYCIAFCLALLSCVSVTLTGCASDSADKPVWVSASDVDFSALERQADSLGLETLGLTTQDRFLIANGILEIFEQDAQEARPDAAGVKRRLQAMQLIHPEGMGRIFKVLALSKNCPGGLRLSGLSDPFARDGS